MAEIRSIIRNNWPEPSRFELQKYQECFSPPSALLSHSNLPLALARKCNITMHSSKCRYFKARHYTHTYVHIHIPIYRIFTVIVRESFHVGINIICLDIHKSLILSSFFQYLYYIYAGYLLELLYLRTFFFLTLWYQKTRKEEKLETCEGKWGEKLIVIA